MPGFVPCLFGSGSFQLNGRAIDDVGAVGKASFSLFKLLESHESEAPAKMSLNVEKLIFLAPKNYRIFVKKIFTLSVSRRPGTS